MLSIKNSNDLAKMMGYYRTSDMIKLFILFPDVTPVSDIVLVESYDDYINNKEFFDSFNNYRIDTLKGRKLINIEGRGGKADWGSIIKQIKDIDPLGVLLLFKVWTVPSERYERYAGISIRVDVGDGVYIDAVGRGFDGREVSKSICVHERYYISWRDLRRCNVEDFKKFQIYQISQDDYLETRNERINFLVSIGISKEVVEEFIPIMYSEIPLFIWKSVICMILKRLEDMEEELRMYNLSTFAISGHTEGKEFRPWQLFDKSRYNLK